QARRHQAKASAESATTYSRLTLDSVTVAGRTFRDVRGAAVLTFGDQPIHGKKAGGLLGLVGFGRLVWTIDYGTKELEIEDGS
ncbi:MAG: hypothetical protein ACYTF8_03745, partial [Planctomycetota bacterium]